MIAVIRRWFSKLGFRRYPTSGERFGHATTRLMAVVEPPRDPRSATTRRMARVR